MESRRIDYLDGIRGLAIGLVVAFHWVGPYAPVWHGGYIGVDLFFVLSGYIITTVLWRSADATSLPRQLGTFFRRRVRRLYPALAGMVLVGGVIFALLPGLSLTIRQIIERGALALVQGTSLTATRDPQTWPPFGQTWSLADEWFFYLIWPAALLLLRRRGVSAHALSALAALAALGLYLGSLALSGWHFYVFPVARGGEMLAGAALALALQVSTRSWPVPGPVWSVAGYASLAAIVGYGALGPHFLSPVFRWLGLPMATAGALILILAGSEARGAVLHQLLKWSPLTLLGRVSYSLYLWHLVVVWGLVKDAWPVPRLVLGVGGVAFTAVATWASYRLLELPFMGSQARLLQRGRGETNQLPVEPLPLQRGGEPDPSSEATPTA